MSPSVKRISSNMKIASNRRGNIIKSIPSDKSEKNVLKFFELFVVERNKISNNNKVTYVL